MMNRPPELLTHAEQKQLAEIIETNVDWMIEQSHIHEVVQDDGDSDD